MNQVLSKIASGWRGMTGTAAGATAALGMLVAACALVAMAAPRASAQLQTDALRQLIARAPVTSKIIVASDPYDEVDDGPGNLTVRDIAGVMSTLRFQLRSLPLAPARAGQWTLTSGFAAVIDPAPSLGSDGRQLELICASALPGHVRLIHGELPLSSPQAKSGRAKITISIAVTEATARRFGLRVGSSLPLPGTKARLRVTGIFQPVGRSTPFWALDPTASVPYLVAPATGEPYWQGGAFFGPGELGAVTTAVGLSNGELRWILPLQVGQLTGGQAQALSLALPTALGQDGNGIVASPSNPPFTVTLYSGLVTILVSFVSQAGAVNSLLSLMSVSLTAIGAAVLLLAIWLLTEQRSAEFATLRARGASVLQLAALALRGCLPAVLLGATIGLAAAFGLTPDGSEALGWWLFGLIMLVVLAGMPLLTLRRHRGTASTGSRPDRPAGKRAVARRVVTESALVLASVGGIITLRDQGLAPGGTDPYTSLAPVLVAIPVAVVVLRCYPLLVRPLLRLAGRRRGVAAFVGLARAVRTTAAAALPVFAMVLALALVAFAGMLRGAVLRGDVAASWQQVGADAVVSAAAGLSPAAQRAISEVPGVRHTAALSLSSGMFPGGSHTFGVVLVDPARYAALLAATPGSASQAAALRASAHGGAGGQREALASAGFAAASHRTVATLQIGPGAQHVRVRLAGQVVAVSAISAIIGDQYLVLPRAVLGRAAPAAEMMLIDGAGLNHHELSAVVRKLAPGALISFRSPVLAALESAPIQRTAYAAFAVGSAVAAVLSMLVLLLTLVIGAQSRELTLARLSTMGLSAEQGRTLVIAEALPQILAALVGGVACAAMLAPLIGPSLNLSVFTQTSAGVPIRIEPAFLAVAAAGLVALAMLTLALQAKMAGRGTASALRMGE